MVPALPEPHGSAELMHAMCGVGSWEWGKVQERPGIGLRGPVPGVVSTCIQLMARVILGPGS